ncbi:hypothetical protein PPYR_12125 [Photinus pyralis]|uniref:Uncharacterized protein n=1 Tax=Photinus pyralis TaxID=7054 RepID=A0A1Y1KA01_PHOPY|nr:uncharacterized protein LOC116177317 [Photinus pyralis]KAB0795286.1 hypothetical protein PPYR_12125 [Photinus pyralis]
MFVEMWKLLLFLSLWTKDVFCLEFNFVDQKVLKSDAKEDILIPESVGLDPTGDLVEVKGIYYSNGVKPRIFVEYPRQDELLTTSNDIGSPEDVNSNENEDGNFQPWSILWYVGSFGGLIFFFLIVSCSEWCCRTRLRNRNMQRGAASPTHSELPPPAYDLFAPPSYDSLCKPSGAEKREYDVYVVPVDTLEALRTSHLEESGGDDSPPSYSNQMRQEMVPRPPTEEDKSETSNSAQT